MPDEKTVIGTFPQLCPRGLSRVQAAAYIGISTTKFDEIVNDGRMPKPRRIDGRKIWDRYELDLAFDVLPRDEVVNPARWLKD